MLLNFSRGEVAHASLNHDHCRNGENGCGDGDVAKRAPYIMTEQKQEPIITGELKISRGGRNYRALRQNIKESNGSKAAIRTWQGTGNEKISQSDNLTVATSETARILSLSLVIVRKEHLDNARIYSRNRSF